METNKTIHYWISLQYATFVITSKNGIVTEAAPISRKSIGHNTNDVINYYKGKGAIVEELQMPRGDR